MTEGFTDFAAAIRLYDDGTAVGEFLCAIPDLVVLASQSATWSQNDDGSITVIGTMYGYFPGTDTPFEDCSTTVTFRRVARASGDLMFPSVITRKECMTPKSCARGKSASSLSKGESLVGPRSGASRTPLLECRWER